MKKNFYNYQLQRFLCAIFMAALFTSCDAGNEDDTNANNSGGGNADVIGTWKTADAGATLEIGDGTWSFIKGSMISGEWKRNANILTLTRNAVYDFGTATLTEGNIVLQVSYSSEYNGTYTLTKSGSNSGGGTSLTIKNESSVEISAVLWNNTAFPKSEYDESIKPGESVTKDVSAGSGYIHFKRKGNAISARTQENVVAADKETKTFTFTDNTVIVEKNNEGNTGSLKNLQSTVVWFDDAEGELQPYYEKRSFVGYYKGYSDFPSGNDIFFHAPKNGQSIAVGGTNTAKLHLRYNLTKPAKLSFWYANKEGDISDFFTGFSINGVVQRTWTNDIDWSWLEFDLQPGQNDLVWEKTDGQYGSRRYYLSLDDILIYYTE